MPANSPALDIATILQTNGLGTLGTDIFVGREPETPDQIITIYDTPGIAPNAKYLRDEPTVQCRTRGRPDTYGATWILAQQIKDTLLGLAPQLIGGLSNYVLFVQIADISGAAGDSLNRPVLISNWQLVRELSSGGNRIPL